MKEMGHPSHKKPGALGRKLRILENPVSKIMETKQSYCYFSWNQSLSHKGAPQFTVQEISEQSEQVKLFSWEVIL